MFNLRSKQTHDVLRKECTEYSQYMDMFREYVEFKEEHPYAELHKDFEHNKIPDLKMNKTLDVDRLSKSKNSTLTYSTY